MSESVHVPRVLERFLAEFDLQATFRVVTRGVEFDLTAEGLSPDAWACPRLLTAPAPGHPGFHFADDAPSPLGLTAAEALAAAEKAGRIILRTGDRVRVESVDFVQADDPLQHEADQEAAKVHLEREREGEVEPAGTITMYPPGRLSDTPPSRMLAALAERRPEDQSADELRALAATVAALQADLIWHPPPSSTDHQIELDILAGTAALLGYRQHELEAERLVVPHARKRQQQSERSRAGALKAAKSKREKWQGEVIAAANQMLEENPHLSAAQIAERIDETRRGAIPGLPTSEQVLKFIRKERRPDGRIMPRPLGSSDL